MSLGFDVELFIFNFPNNLTEDEKELLTAQIFSRFDEIPSLERTREGDQYFKLKSNFQKIQEIMEEHGDRIEFTRDDKSITILQIVESKFKMKQHFAMIHSQTRRPNFSGMAKTQFKREKDYVKEEIKAQNVHFPLPFEIPKTNMKEKGKHQTGSKLSSKSTCTLSDISLGCWMEPEDNSHVHYLPYWSYHNDPNEFPTNGSIICELDSTNKEQMIKFELDILEDNLDMENMFSGLPMSVLMNILLETMGKRNILKKKISVERSSINTKSIYFRYDHNMFEAWISLAYQCMYSVQRQGHGDYKYWDKVPFFKSKHTPYQFKNDYFTNRVNVDNEIEDMIYIRPVIYISTSVEKSMDLKNFIINFCEGVEIKNIQNLKLREIELSLSFIKMENLGLKFIAKFSIMALLSTGIFTVFELNIESIQNAIQLCKIEKEQQNTFADCIELMQDRKSDPLESFLECFTRHHHVLKQYGKENKSIPNGCLQRRINWTRAGKIYFFPELELTNRVIRQWWDDKTKFIKIRFYEENGKKITNFHRLRSTIQKELKNGVEIANHKFSFLGSSSSMLRTKSCWLYAEYEPSLQNALEWNEEFGGIDFSSRQEIWDWMGNFQSEVNKYKRLSRMGQCFSATFEGPSLPKEQINENFEDITNEYNNIKYCFSDGIGTMSENIMIQAVSTKNNPKNPYYASAIQIRLGGFKGVLSYDPRLKGDIVNIRPSQKKFESNSTILEIISISKFHYGHLNHQVILLLSTLKIPDERFFELLDQHLEKLKNFYKSPKSHKSNIILFANLQKVPEIYTMVKEIIESGINLDDIFLYIISESIYYSSVRLIRNKLRILDEKSVNLLGILDEYGILDEGEIFCRISISNEVKDESNKTITGNVIVTKCPCLFPGDIRVLKAIDDKQLYHYINVVVFPQKGRRPHTNEISGSDLDGDTYYLSWNELLIPTKENISQPAQFVNENIPDKNPNITVEDLIEVYCDCNSRFLLGVIANTHKAICDHSPQLANDPRAIKLAEEHSKEVDFPKTGKGGEIPEDCKFTGRPKFMKNYEKAFSESKSVLGKLHSYIDKLEVNLFKEIREHKKVRIDPELIVTGYYMYTNEAIDIYRNYILEMKKILHILGFKRESDLLIGRVRGGRKHKELIPRINFYLLRLKQQFQDIFGRGEQSQDIIKRKASACYLVVYDIEGKYTGIIHSGLTFKEKESFSFCSFPWIVCGEVLCEIKRTAM